jgi:sugar/nucleoside kinase (ribokinase family)
VAGSRFREDSLVERRADVRSSRIDVLVAGTCVADILVRPVPLADSIGGGRLFHVDPIEVTSGGIVCNTGLGLARLGCSVAAASLVGDDPWGSLIRERLTAAGLDAAGIEAAAGHATSTTAVLIDPSGERSFAHHVGGCGAIDLAWIRRQLPRFARASWAVVGYAGLLPGLERDLGDAARMIREAGCRVALETGGSGGTLADVAPALPAVDLYVPSLDEAAAQTGSTDPGAIIQRYRDLGADGIVGVKLGSRGTLLSPTPGEVCEIPCLPAPGRVIDTTGAGDALLAGLLAGIIRGMAPPEACLLGAAHAACCVTAAGATAGLRSFDETLLLARGSPLEDSECPHS